MSGKQKATDSQLAFNRRGFQKGLFLAGGCQTLPGVAAVKVVHIGTGREFVCEKTADGEAFDLPADFKIDANADVFKIVR